MIHDRYDHFIVIPFVFIIAAVIFSMSGFPSALNAAREAEVKHNCHQIQLALESYAVDNGGTYPAYIFGGDRDGWDPESEHGCYVMKGRGRTGLPTDPLIDGGYLSSYPRNPFINPGRGTCTTIFWTGGTYELGWGDPRFGYDGEIMGNCLNDPLNLWKDGDSYPGTTGFGNTMPDTCAAATSFIGMIDMHTPMNPFYSKGGIPPWSGETVGESDINGWMGVFWPGQFFYRAGSSPILFKAPMGGLERYSGEEMPIDPELEHNIWDFRPAIFDRYLLGGYGSTQTKGIDCIRLTRENGTTANNIRGYLNEFYGVHPDYGYKVHLSTPEVFGGGERGVLPTFPYYDANGDWMYGAPDGYPDGIIILLTPGGVYDEYIETASDIRDRPQ